MHARSRHDAEERSVKKKKKEIRELRTTARQKTRSTAAPEQTHRAAEPRSRTHASRQQRGPVRGPQKVSPTRERNCHLVRSQGHGRHVCRVRARAAQLARFSRPQAALILGETKLILPQGLIQGIGLTRGRFVELDLTRSFFKRDSPDHVSIKFTS